MSGKPKAQPSDEAVAGVRVARDTKMGSDYYPSLRELGQAQDILDAWLRETEGEETPAIADLWEKLQGEKNDKVLRWGGYLLNRYAIADLMEAEAKFYLAEGARLSARHKAYVRATDRSEQQLQFQLELQGITEPVVGTYVTVRLQTNPPKCVGEIDVDILETLYSDPDLQRFVAYAPENFSVNRRAILDEARDNPTALAFWLPPTISVVRDKRVVVK